MRATLAIGILALCFGVVAARADPEAPPADCGNYQSVKTGGDAACDAAIAAAQNPKAKSIMLFRRAYMEDAAGDFKTYPKALADLDEAIRLWPDNPSALHERGYLYNEYGRWKEGEADLDAEIMLDPTGERGYQERALSRFGLGDLNGALEDRNASVMLEPSSPRHLLGRAAAEMWLGQFDQAAKDIAAAHDLAQKAGDATVVEDAEGWKSDLAQWSNGGQPAGAAKRCNGARSEEDFRKPTYVADCTRAFLDGKTPSEKADALTMRSMALPLVDKSFSAGLDDLRLAYALESDNPDRQANLGARLQTINHYAEALGYLDRSLARKPSAIGFSERANAKFALGDVDGAFADAKKAIEIKPSSLALMVAGDAVYEKTKSLDQAKLFWIDAYRVGPPDDAIAERLKKAGVPIPPPADAPAAK